MLPEKMQLVVIKQTAKQFHAVSHLMHRQDVTELIIATDAGREGELVARWIMQKAGWKGKTKRLWVSSQTDKAIREGFAHLRPAAEYDSLYRAAQGRAEADWLVGLNVTRALTCKHNAQLSAGRVQTPTLALIVQREEEIRAFRPKEYFSVQAQFDGFRALYRDERGQSRFFDRARAERIVSSCAGQAAVVARLHKELKKLPPPAAYDLTELQRDANKKYAYSAKQTLSIMQRLYETHKLLTYPRTDSRYISDDVVPTLPERLRGIMTGPYAAYARAILRAKPIPTKAIVNNQKVTDHHAIIPTEEPADLSAPSPEANATSMTSWCGASSRCSPLPAAMRKWIWHSPSESTRFMLRGRPSQILAGKLFTVRKQPWRNQKQKRRRKVSPSPFLPRARSLPSGRSVSPPARPSPPRATRRQRF